MNKLLAPKLQGLYVGQVEKEKKKILKTGSVESDLGVMSMTKSVFQSIRLSLREQKLPMTWKIPDQSKSTTSHQQNLPSWVKFALSISSFLTTPPSPPIHHQKSPLSLMWIHFSSRWHNCNFNDKYWGVFYCNLTEILKSITYITEHGHNELCYPPGKKHFLTFLISCH